MKILHVISSIDKEVGGPSLSVINLVEACNRIGLDAEILTFSKNFSNFSKLGFINFLSKPNYKRFSYSRDINRFLEQYKFDVYYSHGLWQYPSIATFKFAIKNKKPLIIMPHGMLYDEALKKSNFIKNVSLFFYLKFYLNKSTVIHATSIQELNSVRALGINVPIAVIPNAVDISGFLKNDFIQVRKKQIGFLGRLDPIKNIEILLYAWAKLSIKLLDWELVLIGDGDSSYKKYLCDLANSLNISNIRFTGFLDGDSKDLALKTLNYIVLPSKSENFGMVVLEALMREIPVIASKGTPWEDLNRFNAGWWIDVGVDPLVEALYKAIGLSDADRIVMGRNGKKLVEEVYSIESVSNQMNLLYKWILGLGEKPNFVYLK